MPLEISEPYRWMREAQEGTWVYVPRGRVSPSPSSSSSTSSSTLEAFRYRTPTARSSMPTPCSDFAQDNLHRAGRLMDHYTARGLSRRRQLKTRAWIRTIYNRFLGHLVDRSEQPLQRGTAALSYVPPGAAGLHDSPVPGGDGWRDQMLRDLGDLRVWQGAKSDWNSRKGPSQGARWRGGTPPTPPSWATVEMTCTPMIAGRERFESGNFKCQPICPRMRPPWLCTCP